MLFVFPVVSLGSSFCFRRSPPERSGTSEEAVGIHGTTKGWNNGPASVLPGFYLDTSGSSQRQAGSGSGNCNHQEASYIRQKLHTVEQY